MRPAFNSRQSEEERNIIALQRLYPNARPPINDPIPWPANGARVNDFDTPGLFSMAFPCLFPYGAGDPTLRDRQKEVSLDQAGKHLAKYAVNMKKVKEILLSSALTNEQRSIVESLHTQNDPQFSYPFVQHTRFIHFLQNTVERHRAYSQRSYYLNQHPEFATLDENEISAIINRGGQELQSLLASMQVFNANINGSPQYLLQCLIEQEGAPNIWFTISMADNHWEDLHACMNRDENGKKTPFPTFNSVAEEASWKRKFVRENPHIVDAYFNDRVHALFDTIFGKAGIELGWLWFHIEYQGRGAPHVHGCLRFKNDPDLTKLGSNVFKGRLASRVLHFIQQAYGNDYFDQYDIELDQFATLEEMKEVGLLKEAQEYTDSEISKMKFDVKEGKRSQQVILAYQEYLITTMNLDPPSDATAEDRDNTTKFDPKTSTVRHPSAINPASVIDNQNAFYSCWRDL